MNDKLREEILLSIARGEREDTGWGPETDRQTDRPAGHDEACRHMQ